MQEKLVDDRDRNRDGGRDSTVIAGAASVESALSRKRMADGNLKDVSMSPVARGHSRNVSAVSMASTSGSRIGEVSYCCPSPRGFLRKRAKLTRQRHS